MLEFLIILILGIVAGILVGLMPGLPAYIGPLVLFPFLGIMSVDQILAFWLASHIGSQYFGSVAAILLKIPGEASSMIYLRDLDYITTTDRLALVRQTAWGSTIGSITSLAIMLVVYYVGLSTEIVQLTSNNIKLTLLLSLMFMLCWFSEHRVLSLFLFLIGAFFAEKTSFEFPIWVYRMQEYTTDVTLFGLILGFLIIPEFIKEITKSHDSDELIVKQKEKSIFKEKLDIKSMIRGTWIGSIIGLIPGPSHILSSIVSYNSYNKIDHKKKIISAESANNSATITSLLPFLYVGLPITLSEFLLNDLLQVKLFMVPSDFKSAWPLFNSFNFIELCFAIILVCTVIYHFMAQMFLSFYARLMRLAYDKLKIIFLALIIYLIYIDLKFNPVYILPYFCILVASSYLGYQLLKKNINVLPLLFGFILGDMMAWSLYHFYQLHLY